MSSVPRDRFIGDEWRIPVNLKSEVSGPIEVSEAATVTAGAVRVSDSLLQGTAVSVLPATTGAVWAAGRLVVVIPAATTAVIPAGTYQLSIKVVTGGAPQTYHTQPFTVRKSGL